MNPPRVSVLLPVRNGAPTLARALDSLRTQSLPDWECVAVNDGSTDTTPVVLAEAARHDPRIRVLHQPALGIVPALHAALAAAHAPLLARFDADDVCHPERLEVQAAFLDAHPHLGLAGCLVDFDGDRTTHTGYATHVDWLNSLTDESSIRIARFIESPFAHPSVMFRREVVGFHGSYREGPFPEDYELWLRWMEAGVRMAKIPRVLLRWNDPPTRLSRTDPRYATEAFYQLKAQYLARWWRSRTEASHGGSHRPIWVWGAGRLTRRRVDLLLAQGIAIERYIDIDPRKHGRHRDGRRVVSPDSLPASGDVFVLGYVAVRGARESHRAFLQNRGYVEGRDFLFAA